MREYLGQAPRSATRGVEQEQFPGGLPERQSDDGDQSVAATVSGDYGVALGVDDRDEGRGETVPERQHRLGEAAHARPSRSSSRSIAAVDHSLTATTATATANAIRYCPNAMAPMTPAVLAAFAMGDQFHAHTRRS